MTEDCSRKKGKKISIFPLQEFVNPSTKVEMEITKFQPLLISKSHHLQGKLAHTKPHQSLSCVVTADEGLQGTGRVWEHLKE